MLVHKHLVTEKETYSYYENSSKNYTQTVLLLLPGGSDGTLLKEFIGYFPKNVRIISPDLPGRGEAPYIADNSIRNIARWINGFVVAMGLRESILVGISFGGSTANEMLSQSKGLYKKVYLIASGEYFTPLKRIIITILFYPPTVPKICEKIWIYILLHWVHMFKFVPYDSSFNYRGLFKQWLTIVNYKMDVGRRDETRVGLIFLSRDTVVNPSSIQKLQTIYPNHTTHFLDMAHNLTLSESASEQLSEIMKDLA